MQTGDLRYVSECVNIPSSNGSVVMAIKLRAKHRVM